MALSKRDTKIVEQIVKKYGRVLDLQKSPSALIEILRTFSHVFDDPPGVGGGGGVSGVSTIAVGITPPEAGGRGDVQMADVMKAILKLQRDVNAIGKTLSKRIK